MALVRLGPFSEMHFSILKDKLDAAGAGFERIEDPELVKAYLVSRKNFEVHSHPTYSGSMPEFIYLDVQREFLLLLKRDLDALGFSLVMAEPPEDEPSEAEESADLAQRAVNKKQKRYAAIFTLLLVLAALLFFVAQLIKH